MSAFLKRIERIAKNAPSKKDKLAMLRSIAHQLWLVYGQEGDPDPATLSDEALMADYGPEALKKAIDKVYGGAS